MHARVVLAVLTTGLMALPIGASAQEATLVGQVVDATGAVLPGVVVRAIHEATGTTTEVVTDGRGGFESRHASALTRSRRSWRALPRSRVPGCLYQSARKSW